jgi:hypothetical protein
VLFFLTGCAGLSVRPEFEHMSHLSQHEPFTDHPTGYGENIANLIVHWQHGPLYVEAGEGIALAPYYPASQSFGEIVGPKEEFSFRLGYVLWGER